ncbi:MAG: DUF2232 domain-containing protein [Gemmatimonadetes bacterium]|nr:DUF2232 domain-containing protein [Gemmatimonadota bacterium]
MTERGWTLARASLLVVATLLLSPMSPVWFVFVPLALLLLAFRSEDWMSVAVAAVILGLGFAGSRPGGIEWFVPRAWSLIAGGAFVAVSIGRGRNAWLDRSLQAIGVGLAFVLLIGLARPGVLEGVNWWMTGEIRQAAVAAGGILEQLQGSADPEIRRQLEVAVQRWVGFQQDVYPAMLLLATVAALGLAWFGFERLSGRFRSPGPLREFRFSNHLIWLLIGGLCLLVLPLGRVAFRVGENATLFMGGLYLVRGAAILLWIGATAATTVWSAVLLSLAALFLYPVVLGTALLLGLSDTWIDLRERLSRARTDNDL